MSTFIDMQAWRAKHAPKPLALLETADEPVYACVGCGSRLFRILETGQVRCARCSAEIAARTAVAAANPSFIPPWIPVLSLFAVLMAVGTCLIVSEVL
jgi:DNA-directed RNA polymerase subunit RPC12/RpoP